MRKVGSDGFRIGYQPTLKKVVSDRRASLDEETEVKPAIRKLVEDEFRRGASIPVVPFPRDGAEIPDTPRLTLVVADPEAEWSGDGPLRAQIAEWTRQSREVAAPLSGRARVVPQEARPGPAREGRAGARVEAGRARGRGRHARWRVRPKMTGRTCSRRSRTRKEPPRTRCGATTDSRSSRMRKRRTGSRSSTSVLGHSSSGETLCGRVIARAQVRGTPQRVCRCRLHRAQLAAGAQGLRCMAARQPSAEFPERIAHAPRRSRHRFCAARLSTSSRTATSAWPRGGEPTAATSAGGSRTS